MLVPFSSTKQGPNSSGGRKTHYQDITESFVSQQSWGRGLVRTANAWPQINSNQNNLDALFSKTALAAVTMPMHYSIRLITLKMITGNKIVMSCFRDARVGIRTRRGVTPQGKVF